MRMMEIMEFSGNIEIREIKWTPWEIISRMFFSGIETHHEYPHAECGEM